MKGLAHTHESHIVTCSKQRVRLLPTRLYRHLKLRRDRSHHPQGTNFAVLIFRVWRKWRQCFIFTGINIFAGIKMMPVLSTSLLINSLTSTKNFHVVCLPEKLQSRSSVHVLLCSNPPLSQFSLPYFLDTFRHFTDLVLGSAVLSNSIATTCTHSLCPVYCEAKK